MSRKASGDRGLLGFLGELRPHSQKCGCDWVKFASDEAKNGVRRVILPQRAVKIAGQFGVLTAKPGLLVRAEQASGQGSGRSCRCCCRVGLGGSNAYLGAAHVYFQVTVRRREAFGCELHESNEGRASIKLSPLVSKRIGFFVSCRLKRAVRAYGDTGNNHEKTRNDTKLHEGTPNCITHRSNQDGRKQIFPGLFHT